jgi:SnoaL-like domain
MVEQRAEERHTTLRRFYDAFNARDLEAIIAEMHPEVEFESRFARAGGTTYRGHEGIRGWLADLADAWEPSRSSWSARWRWAAIARSPSSRCTARPRERDRAARAGRSRGELA